MIEGALLLLNHHQTSLDREELTDNSYSAADQTLYRVLRKHYELELVDFRKVPGKGPQRKLYWLSPLGKQLLRDFTRRNITLFTQPQVTSLMMEETK